MFTEMFMLVSYCFHRYILEVLKPGPRAVISVLEILTRIVRHSQDAALAVTCCPRLMSLIMTSFVPRDWRAIGTNVLI